MLSCLIAHRLAVSIHSARDSVILLLKVSTGADAKMVIPINASCNGAYCRDTRFVPYGLLK